MNVLRDIGSLREYAAHQLGMPNLELYRLPIQLHRN